MAGTAQRVRAYQGPKFFERGFRPFFLSAVLFAALAMPLWAAILTYGLVIPVEAGGVNWHAHEMVFGYTTAMIAGFLLTAVPNWTGRLPVAGAPLAMLWAIWLAGRIAMGFSSIAPLGAAAVDALFLVILAAVLMREILGGKNKRNIPVVLVVSLLATANIWFHFLSLSGEATQPAERAALGLIAILITLIGGRIIPSFTRNWMARQGMDPLPVPANRLDTAIMAFGAITIGVWIITPDWPVTAYLLAFAAITYLARLSRWRGLKTLGEPLVVILHIGYLWLPVWLGLTALSALMPQYMDATSALHALTSGAIGTMTLAVAMRATLGHSGQPIIATPAIVTVFALLNLGTILRISAASLPFDFIASVSLAGLLWAAAMGMFLLVLWPILLGRR